MQFYKFLVTRKYPQTQDIFLLKLTSIEKLNYKFSSGQHCYIKNPFYINPEETHIFSIASSPADSYLELCIRVYGKWTQHLSKIKPGQHIYISEPQGEFLWKDSKNAVFLAGGVGISSIMSILRDVYNQEINIPAVLIYCCRDMQSAIYKEELENLQNILPNFKNIYVFSEQETKNGYFGFLSKEIISKEIDYLKDAAVYISGPPDFINLSKTLLSQLNLNLANIYDELDIRTAFAAR